MRLSLTLGMAVLAATVFAQSTVTGKITDEMGTGLPGVSILVKGTTNGTSTDNDGNFSLSVPSDATLVVSFIGYKSQEVMVNNRTRIDSAMLSRKTLRVVSGLASRRRSRGSGAPVCAIWRVRSQGFSLPEAR